MIAETYFFTEDKFTNRKTNDGKQDSSNTENRERQKFSNYMEEIQRIVRDFFIGIKKLLFFLSIDLSFILNFILILILSDNFCHQLFLAEEDSRYSRNDFGEEAIFERFSPSKEISIAPSDFSAERTEANAKGSESV